MPISSIDTHKLIKDAQKTYEKNDAKELYDLVLSTVASLANTVLSIGIALESLTKSTNQADFNAYQSTSNFSFFFYRPRSYAAAAAHALILKLISTKTLRETTVTPDNETQSQKQRSGYTLLTDINKNIQGEKAVAAQRLASGDVALAFETPEGRIQ